MNRNYQVKPWNLRTTGQMQDFPKIPTKSPVPNEEGTQGSDTWWKYPSLVIQGLPG